MFDADNPTNIEEVLQERIEVILVKLKSKEDEIEMLNFQQTRKTPPLGYTQMYVNPRGQLINLVDGVRNGRNVQNHEIISFDFNKLPQASQHNYTG